LNAAIAEWKLYETGDSKRRDSEIQIKLSKINAIERHNVLEILRIRNLEFHE
jgi:hypothetical protein